jgi:hypothetical protein
MAILFLPPFYPSSLSNILAGELRRSVARRKRAGNEALIKKICERSERILYQNPFAILGTQKSYPQVP